MTNAARFGAVIFTGDRERLTRFYQAVTGLNVSAEDDDVTVLSSDTFELVIHDLRGEPVTQAAPSRRESWVKPFFPVKSLEEARRRATAFGGKLRPAGEEWQARGFTACEGVDPDGNPVQFRS